MSKKIVIDEYELLRAEVMKVKFLRRIDYDQLAAEIGVRSVPTLRQFMARQLSTLYIAQALDKWVDDFYHPKKKESEQQ